MKKNKITQYLIYAFGEIILVVVGILIALYINNENQAKKNREYELTMLEEIKSVLSDDIYNFHGGLGSVGKTQQSVFYLTIARNDPDYPQDSLNKYITQIRRSGIGVSINYSAYESLKSTGLDRISNSDLRSEITNLYEVKLRGVEFWINDFIRQKLDEKGRMVADLFEKKIYPDSTDGIQVEYIVNYKFIHNNPEFDELLVLSGGYVPIAKRYLNFAIREMESLIEQIDKELEN